MLSEAWICQNIQRIRRPKQPGVVGGLYRGGVSLGNKLQPFLLSSLFPKVRVLRRDLSCQCQVPWLFLTVRLLAFLFTHLQSLNGLPRWHSDKNLHAVQELQETWVQSLDWEGPLEKGVAIHSSILAWRIPWTEEPVGSGPWGHKESVTTEVT